MAKATTELRSKAAANLPELSEDRADAWEDACRWLLEMVAPELRPEIERRLRHLHTGGAGLREWVATIAFRGGAMPSEIPAELMQVYLTDAEAAPLHDCESCGLAVPVRPNRLEGTEGEPEFAYFPECPVCHGRTGLYYYWSRRAEADGAFTDRLRRRRPR
jgi:hypothetical protein